jgi:hypothetical protein
MARQRKPRLPSDPDSNLVRFYSDFFTPEEIEKLRAFSKKDGLIDEIDLVRVALRRFFDRVSKDATTLDDWARALRTVSSTCGRIADLIKQEEQRHEGEGDSSFARDRALAQALKELGI